MPLRNDLLNPISPENPTGINLRYDPLYDKIKEARREDPDDPQGEWKRERKLADWVLTIKLIGEALATQSKDIQLAAWLAQALLRREGFASFRDGLDLVRKYLVTFWDGLYPEIEDGDLELRVAPLEWLATESDREPDRPVGAVKMVPITRGGLDWNKYREARDDVGTEEQAQETYEKQQARERKIAEGKTSPEKFEKEFEESPKQFYFELEQTLDGTLESISQLSKVCDEKFGDVSPSFGLLRKALEEIRQTVHILLMRKREKEPDETPAPGSEPAPDGEQAMPELTTDPKAAAAATARKPAALTALPESWDDAVQRVVAAAKFMRQQYPHNPASYLMLRGLRWGELRASGTSIDQTRLAAPPTDLRQNLKRAALDSQWMEVLETVEIGMGMECGRGWLDLQRYLARACKELGGYYEPVRRAVISELQLLLETYPQLPEMTMMDDMPTANPETLAWLKKQVLSKSGTTDGNSGQPEDPSRSAPRSFELAMQAARAGRPEAGVELLMREIALEPSGRGRFQRKVQLAHLCLGGGNEAIALPMLQAAAAEIEEKKLEEWEPRETLAYPLGLFYQCLVKTNGSTDERERLYSWICRLDPMEAMKLER